MVENPQATVEFEGVALTRQVTVDETYIATAARTFYRFAFTRPVFAIVLVALTLGSAAYIAFSFGDNLGYPDAFLIGLAVFPFVMWLVMLIAHRRLRSQLRSRLPIGCKLQAGFTDHSIALRSPIASSVIEFAAFEKLIERPGFVILKQRGSSIYQLLPAGLFTDAALADIRSTFRT